MKKMNKIANINNVSGYKVRLKLNLLLIDIEKDCPGIKQIRIYKDNIFTNIVIDIDSNAVLMYKLEPEMEELLINNIENFVGSEITGIYNFNKNNFYYIEK